MFEPRCSICKHIKTEMLKDGSSKLERRLFNCAKYVKGGESQRKIGTEYGFNPISLSKHLKYHQNPNENVLVADRMDRSLDKRSRSAVEIQDSLVDQGLKDLEEGKLKMTAATLAKIAKDKQDVEEKNKDRGLKIMEMVFSYASREQLPDIANQLTGGNLERP